MLVVLIVEPSIRAEECQGLFRVGCILRKQRREVLRTGVRVRGYYGRGRNRLLLGIPQVTQVMYLGTSGVVRQDPYANMGQLQWMKSGAFMVVGSMRLLAGTGLHHLYPPSTKGWNNKLG